MKRYQLHMKYYMIIRVLQTLYSNLLLFVHWIFEYRDLLIDQNQIKQLIYFYQLLNYLALNLYKHSVYYEDILLIPLFQT